MDTTFWIGIAVGGLISFLASIAANLSHSKMVGFLDSRRTFFRTRRKKQAIALHKIIGELRTGARDRYSYLLRQIIVIMFGFTLGATNTAAGMVIVSLIDPEQHLHFFPTDRVTQFRLLLVFVLAFAASFGLLVCFKSLNRFREITNALENYSKYQSAYKENWGDTI